MQQHCKGMPRYFHIFQRLPLWLPVPPPRPKRSPPLLLAPSARAGAWKLWGQFQPRDSPQHRTGHDQAAAAGTKEQEPNSRLPPNGGRGASVEYTAFTVSPRAFSSRRMIRAKGHTLVCSISATRKAVGSSLLPAPMQLMTGAPQARARAMMASFPDTESMASHT